VSDAAELLILYFMGSVTLVIILSIKHAADEACAHTGEGRPFKR